jgi:hypothetical protein
VIAREPPDRSDPGVGDVWKWDRWMGQKVFVYSRFKLRELETEQKEFSSFGVTINCIPKKSNVSNTNLGAEVRQIQTSHLMRAMPDRSWCCA